MRSIKNMLLKKILVEEWDKEENVEVTGSAATSCLKSR